MAALGPRNGAPEVDTLPLSAHDWNSAVSADGGPIATSGSTTVRIWDDASGTLRSSIGISKCRIRATSP